VDPPKKPMPELAIKLENLSKFYKLYTSPKERLKEALHPLKKKFHRQFFALKDINLEVKKGEILGIVGRNGSGKSTLLKLISAIIQPSSGKVIVNGAISALLELGAELNPEFTGIQNIYFSGTMMGFSRKEIKEKVDDIVAFADIGDFIYQSLKTYSSGMKARLGFALAINMEPDILILDEVLAVGDELFKRKCYAKMEEYFKSERTILFVTHSVNVINEICSRAILLDKGEQILEGVPKFVTSHYQKMLFARPGETKKIREEIIRLNHDNENKKAFVFTEKKKIYKEEKEEKRTNKKKPGEYQQKPFFIKGFKSKSLVEQKNYDVQINDIEIRTPGGQRVNALVMKEDYIYSYKVQFNIEAENVIFSMAIKNEKGMVVSSAKTGIGGRDYGNIINFIKKGDQYLIDWNFKCSLLPGNYYTNIGIRSFFQGKEPVVLNRIADALVFKVQDIPYLLHGGICHLNQDADITCLKWK
jgi:lipopolysaccharide transport system ATP-binding protein